MSEKLRDVDVNDRVKLGRVLMLGSRHETIIGRPLVPNASVTAVIEEQFQDAKVLIFKKRRRKNSRRLKGHRQVTCVAFCLVNRHGDPSCASKSLNLHLRSAYAGVDIAAHHGRRGHRGNSHGSISAGHACPTHRAGCLSPDD